MKKILLSIAILFSVAVSAQNFYGLGIDTITGRPGYKYLFRPLYTQSPLYKVNDSTIGVNASFIGVDSIPTFQYGQTNGSRVVKHGLMDSITTNGLQNSPSQLFQGVDTVSTGLKKKVGTEIYVDPILNTSAVYPSYRLRFFMDTTVNSSTGVGTGYPAMDLYHNAAKGTNGISTTLDFPNGGTITGSSYSTGNVFGIQFGSNSVSFPMGSNTPLTVQNGIVQVNSGASLYFQDGQDRVSRVAVANIGVGAGTLDQTSGGIAVQAISLGNAGGAGTAGNIGAGRQFSVYGSEGTYGSFGLDLNGGVTNLNNNGSIAYTTGSPNITGTGTKFLSMFNVSDQILISTHSGSQLLTVSSITDDTHLVCTGNVTIGSASGKYDWLNNTLDGVAFFKILYNGTPYIARPFITNNVAGTTTIAAGTGAGTSPTISITGNDISGYISVTTGTSCTATGDIATITFARALMGTPTSIIITPANSNAAAELTKVYVDQSSASTTTWKLKNTSSALTDATAYKFYYYVTQ